MITSPLVSSDKPITKAPTYPTALFTLLVQHGVGKNEYVNIFQNNISPESGAGGIRTRTEFPPADLKLSALARFRDAQI